MFKQFVKSTCNALGVEVHRKRAVEPVGDAPQYPEDFDASLISLIERVRPYTMTSTERIASLRQAVEYVVRYDIPGDIVECGVWKGGSMMAIALTLQELKAERKLHLFDTFDGMSAPSEHDLNKDGEAASQLLETEDKASSHNWAFCPEDVVRRNLESTGYPMEHVSFVKGKVEDTIPKFAPQSISLLRLDTDWYESTYHELKHLFPCLAPGGVLIIDDYGHWQGARKAVDQYLEEAQVSILLNRVDYTGRIGVKLHA